MRKRAALIRTLVYDPPMILMDEPFAAVDAQTRTQLQEDLLRLWSLKRKTIIFVTHDITEAIALGDRALVLTPAAGAHRGRASDPDPAAAQRQGHFHAAGLRRRSTNACARTCNESGIGWPCHSGAGRRRIPEGLTPPSHRSGSLRARRMRARRMTTPISPTAGSRASRGNGS